MAGFIRKAVVVKNVAKKEDVSVVDGMIANRVAKNAKGKGPVRKVARYKIASNRLK